MKRMLAAISQRATGSSGAAVAFLSPCAPRHLPLMLTLILFLTGCKHLGPKTVAVDRFDYSASIAESWKQQTLLNIVKLRYLDLPVFVDVASVVSGYSMQRGVNINGTLSSENAVQGNYASLGGHAIYTDRPTVTYVPLTGEKFLRGLITPIDPKHIFFMLQAGYAANFILGLTVESLNGVRNRSTTGGTVREADPGFIRALDLLREVQAAGAFGMRVEEDTVKGSTAVVFFRGDDVPAEMAEKPAGAFAAVRYRDHWFWVNNGDRQTKRALTAVMFFFTLAETGDMAKLPLVTIPAQ